MAPEIYFRSLSLVGVLKHYATCMSTLEVPLPGNPDEILIKRASRIWSILWDWLYKARHLLRN